jgi:hypothetical protein
MFFWGIGRDDCCVAPLHLTPACDAQGANNITSLAGEMFPAGLIELCLVSFGCRFDFGSFRRDD